MYSLSPHRKDPCHMYSLSSHCLSLSGLCDYGLWLSVFTLCLLFFRTEKSRAWLAVSILTVNLPLHNILGQLFLIRLDPVAKTKHPFAFNCCHTNTKSKNGNCPRKWYMYSAVCLLCENIYCVFQHSHKHWSATELNSFVNVYRERQVRFTGIQCPDL